MNINGENIPIQIVFPELTKEGKIIIEPEEIMETRNWQLRIDQFQSIS